MRSRKTKIIVVGGGSAGIFALLSAYERGADVSIFMTLPPRRAPSVCEINGINAALDTKNEDDSTWLHTKDTIRCGDFLAPEKPVASMCAAAPRIINLLDRMGVLFDRTPEGTIDLYRSLGSSRRRMAKATGLTGRQVMAALHGQLLRLAALEKIRVFEGWEFLSLVLNENGDCRGAIFANTKNMEIKAFASDAVIVCTGGYEGIFGSKSTNPRRTGASIARCFMQGAAFANPEFVDIHPFTVAGPDKHLPVGDFFITTGSRMDYLQEDQHLNMDVSKMEKRQKSDFADIFSLYRGFTGEEPFEKPIRLVAAANRSLGGLWTDADHATSVAGLFAAGEASCLYHGAASLGGNELLASIFGGMRAGRSSVEYTQGLGAQSDKTPSSVFDATKTREEDKNAAIIRREGEENTNALRREMAEALVSGGVAIKNNNALKAAGEKLAQIKDRFAKASPFDRQAWANDEIFSMRRLEGEIEIARLHVAAAVARDESRGSHIKTDFPKRDDEKWRVMTKALWHEGELKLDYSEKII